MPVSDEEFAALRSRVDALEELLQTDEFSELPERIVALEQRSPHRTPKVISLAEIYTKSSGGARAVLLYLVIAAIGLPALLIFWLMNLLEAHPDNARNLITIVFCLGTMAVAGGLAYVAIRKNDLDKAKDVLIILIGIFGTIVGFYFGSAEHNKPNEGNDKPNQRADQKQEQNQTPSANGAQTQVPPKIPPKPPAGNAEPPPQKPEPPAGPPQVPAEEKPAEEKPVKAKTE
ncbi:hypothetical protein Enr10x_20450 [Gimesia panareensis]|uniref:Preprotein translocase subunit SecG n=1 Tax=Gimesia panareensis TaxID=2527978 RepID=A0A517Q537_9PLAN|nr:DUF805 domain-containing protein [Gimesia panareensis]QDT26735.1 hypothetical protein Enr10x_20450 [Gimesia panareensis]